MKLAIRVTDPGNDAKWNFLFSVFNVASDDQSFLERVVSQRRLSEMIDDALAKSIFDNHYSELFEFYDVKVFLQTDVPESVPRECRLCAYSKFVVDFIQKTCKADVVNTDRASNFLSFLRGIENGRMPKLSIREDIYLNRGIGRLAQQKNLSSDEYQILLFRNFTTGCQKGVGVAVKLILICGEKPDCSLTSDELRRFRLLKDVGEDGFARHFVSASERATNKAMTIKPMALLELNQKDLREMWRCLSGE